MTKKLVIFDLDGTLFQGHLVTVSAVHKALEDYNLPLLKEEEITDAIGSTMDEFCKRLIPECHWDKMELFKEAVRKYEGHFIPISGRLYENVEKVLDEFIAKGYQLAICSNGGMNYIDMVLSHCGIKNRFKYIRGRSENKNKGIIIGELINEATADFAIMVGDKHHDIEGARANKIPVIGVTYGYGLEEVKRADFIVDDVEGILRAVEQSMVLHHIEREIFTKKHKVIGVNGVDTSGKTEFSKGLNSYLISKGYKTQLLHLDAFHNPSTIRSQGKDPIDAYINNAFNLQILEKEILQPLKVEGCLYKELMLLDLDTDQYTNKAIFNVDNDTIVILEGVLLYRDTIDQYFDCRIFLDIGFDEVLKRAEIRDVPKYGIEFLDKYRTKYIPIQKWYIENHKPKAKSDFVIDNTNYFSPKIIDKGNIL